MTRVVVSTDVEEPTAVAQTAGAVAKHRPYPINNFAWVLETGRGYRRCGLYKLFEVKREEVVGVPSTGSGQVSAVTGPANLPSSKFSAALRTLQAAVSNYEACLQATRGGYRLSPRTARAETC